jgi:hypothetical protein
MKKLLSRVAFFILEKNEIEPVIYTYMNDDICPVCSNEKKPKNKYCSAKCRNIVINRNKDYTKQSGKIQKTKRENFLKKNGELKDFKVICHKCSNELITNEYEFRFPIKDKYYCSRSCANSRENREYTKTVEFRDRISNIVKEFWTRPEYVDKIINQQSNRKYTSVGEVLIREHFKTKYSEDEWVHGGALKYKGSSLIRDLYSNKLKVCVEYDGIWHFKDINGQLEEKQRKDLLLEEWCLDNNFRLIRIKEEVFYNNKELCLQYIEDLIYDNSEQFVKIYDFIKK